jgi:hypothetical protein
MRSELVGPYDDQKLGLYTMGCLLDRSTAPIIRSVGWGPLFPHPTIPIRERTGGGPRSVRAGIEVSFTFLSCQDDERDVYDPLSLTRAPAPEQRIRPPGRCN